MWAALDRWWCWVLLDEHELQDVGQHHLNHEVAIVVVRELHDLFDELIGIDRQQVIVVEQAEADVLRQVVDHDGDLIAGVADRTVVTVGEREVVERALR